MLKYFEKNNIIAICGRFILVKVTKKIKTTTTQKSH